MSRKKKPKTLDDYWGAGAEDEVKAVVQNLDEFQKHLDDEKSFAATGRFFTYMAAEERKKATEAMSRPLRVKKKKKGAL